MQAESQDSNCNIPNVCPDDSIIVHALIEDWIQMPSDLQLRCVGGWEPMWGMWGIFNGTLQQGDCGEQMCSDNCAKAAADYMNKFSNDYKYKVLVQQDKSGVLRGECESCGWCEKCWIEDKDAGDTCGMCTCPVEAHVAIKDYRYFMNK